MPLFIELLFLELVAKFLQSGFCLRPHLLTFVVQDSDALAHSLLPLNHLLGHTTLLEVLTFDEFADACLISVIKQTHLLNRMVDRGPWPAQS